MKHYSREQMKQLEDADVVQHFMTATVSDYKRGTTSRQNTLVADIYDEVTGLKVSRNFGCSVCCFRLYRDAGNLYFASQTFWAKYDKARETREARKNVHMKDGEKEITDKNE